jgi:mRNA-degrading endonuclease RelE of RelBE toxin-antitoxin system
MKPFTQKADKDYARMPPLVRKAFEKQLRFLLGNLHHPSLHAKKYSEALDIWQGRVTRDWRFYFQIKGDEYVILSVIVTPNSGQHAPGVLQGACRFSEG